MLCPECGRLIEGDATHCDLCSCSVYTTCARCRQSIARSEAIESADGCRVWCPGCFNQYFTHCFRCGRETDRSRARAYRDNYYCRTCFEQSFIRCEHCSNNMLSHDVYNTPDNNLYCETCYNQSCGHCANCGESQWRENMVQTDHGWLCQGCYRQNDEWESTPFVVSDPHYEEVGSNRRYGVELETSRCNDYRELFGQTIWECKSDCSIAGKEFVSPVLYGDEGLNEITSFCAIARQRRWMVDHYCGYHAHFDVSRESWDSLRSIAYAYRKTYEMWCRLVSERRASNAYCGSPDYSLQDIARISNATDWEYFVGARDRFEFVNWRSYMVHGSFEVRSHDASLKPTVICNWIKIHARFIDSVSAMTIDEIDEKFGGDVEAQFEEMESFIGSELSEYYANLTCEYGNPIRPLELVCLDPPYGF